MNFRSEITNLKKRIDDISEEILTLKSLIEKNSGKMERSEKQVDEHGTNITELDNKIKKLSVSLEEEIDMIDNILDSYSKTIDQLLKNTGSTSF
ncbi:hypothetical protein KHQ82_10495 [Mycoplasmatota bacterium]|nr:hypothetical protein KHQ82_10495 [Mycoplasmatota bacterium]